MGGLPYESVKSAAMAQINATPFYKSKVLETRWYDGYFRAASSTSKLALLSDDGTSVWINGVQVLNRAGQGQGFEQFDSTFVTLAPSGQTSFTAGQVYHLRLQYTNTIHSSDADVDGISLWAFDGGGTIVPAPPTPSITFAGELLSAGSLRACVGGYDDHAASDFQYRAHTRRVDMTVTSAGKPLPSAAFTLQFDGNKGHDYGNGSIKKTARLHNMTDSFDDAHWKETLDVTTDANGKVSVWVLSGDVICQPKLQVMQKVDPNQPPVKVGELVCDFGAAESIVRDPNNLGDPNDTGWLFNKEWLDPGVQTTAKVYMKFMIDPALGDRNGNWSYVNEHQILIQVDSVDLSDDSTSQGSLTDYATVVPNGSVTAVTLNDGAATATVQAGNSIRKAKVVYFSGQDESQWDN